MEQSGAFVEDASCNDDQLDIIAQLDVYYNTCLYVSGAEAIAAQSALNTGASPSGGQIQPPPVQFFVTILLTVQYLLT